MDTTWFLDLDVKCGESDFMINGKVFDAMCLPFRIEHDIRADLEIHSGLFDQPGFLSFAPGVGEHFPHMIRDMDLDASV